MLIKIMMLAAMGIAVSAYAFMVEKKIREDSVYKPLCDISDRFSCSKPILSEYGTFFGISNSLVGMLFYGAMFIFGLLSYAVLAFWGALAACGVSIVLAYILLIKIKSFCFVCSSIYLINGLLLWASWQYK